MSVLCVNPERTLVAISGIAGGLGSALGLEAVSAGYLVKGIYHQSLPVDRLLNHPRVSLKRLDLRTEQFVLDNTNRYDRIVFFHAAAAAFTPTAVNVVDTEQATSNWATAVTGARNFVTHTVFNLRRTHIVEIYLITSSILGDPFRLPPMVDYVLAKSSLRTYCDFLEATVGESVSINEVCPRYFASQFNESWPEPVKSALASGGTDDPQALAKLMIADLGQSIIRKNDVDNENR
ncbi:hypothetical protein OAO72_00240 [Alphaproteobacteria bacterium]|nr:hypothetical protein [Alphaproteobacteria bacterium]